MGRTESSAPLNYPTPRAIAEDPTSAASMDCDFSFSNGAYLQGHGKGDLKLIDSSDSKNNIDNNDIENSKFEKDKKDEKDKL